MKEGDQVLDVVRKAKKAPLFLAVWKVVFGAKLSDIGIGPAMARPAARMYPKVAGLCAVILTAGCTSQQIEQDPSAASGSALPSMFSGFRSNDLKARSNANAPIYGTMGETTSPGARIYPAADAQATSGLTTGSIASSAASIGARQEGDGFQLNFENADATAVCKTILGDILQVNYTVDTRVSGQITLSSARPIPKSSLIKLLETALKSINTSVVREGAIYRVIPASDALGTGPVEVDAASDGFGTTVIPAKYVSAQTIGRILENFATRPGAIKIDADTNLIIVQGTALDRRSAMDAAAAVDTDQMRTQSVGIFPLSNSSPEVVISELNKILDNGEGGFGHNQVELQPMSRMNGILVVARHRDGLDAVTRWIARLDRNDPAAVGVKVYRLRYAQAKTVAAMLNDMFGGKAVGTGQKDQDALQPAQSGQIGSLAQSPVSASTASASTAPSSSAPQWTPTPMASPSNSQSSSALNQPIFSNSQSNASSQTDPTPTGSTGTGSMPKVRVTPDIANNSLLVIAGPQEYRVVEQAIRQLDRAPVQVAIEATIAEVTLTDQLQYGVQAYLHSSDLGTSSDKGSIGLSAATSAASAAISATVPGANLILGPASNPRFVLNALHALTSVKVLSSPSLVVIDNQQATLQVGDQVAIKTQSSVSTATSTAPVINSIDYKDTGIILRVIPHVHANGEVNLEVEQEISSVVGNTGGTDGLTPTISQRRVKSTIVVSSGQTVLLAGLISDTQNNSKNTVPGVEQWQWLSNVLSNKDNQSTRTELIIFIKPKIMRDAADAQAVSEEFRDRLTFMRADAGLPPAKRQK